MATDAKRVLIVEDERPLAHVLENKLKHEGFVTKVVGNGKDALTELATGKYDVMLLDMMMPIMDGFTVLEQLHTLAVKPVTYALSNLSLHDDQDRVLGMGAKKYFIKSETPLDDIVQEIKSV